MKTLRLALVGMTLMSLVGTSGAFASNDEGACYYRTGQEGEFVECGADGCLYPDGSTVTPDGKFDSDGKPFVNYELDLDEQFETDMEICYAEDGETVLGGEDFDGDEDEREFGEDRHENNFERDFGDEDFDFYEEHLSQFDLGAEIAFMEDEMAAVQAVFDALKDIDNKKVRKAAKRLNGLADRAMVLLERMREVIVDGEVTDEGVVEEAWDIMDEMEKDAMQQIKILVKFFDKNPGELEKLGDDDRLNAEEWMEEDRGGPRGGKKGPRFDEIYEGFGVDGNGKDKLMERIRNEARGEVMREVEGALMEELAAYLDEDIISNMLNNIDYLGRDYLDNSVGVYEEIDDFEGMDAEFLELGERTKGMVISDEVAERLREKWDEVDVAFAADDQDELDILRREIEALMEENGEVVFRGEDSVMFEDLALDHWSMKYVFELREDNVIDGYRDKDGNKLGEFRPENDVTIAELMKMGAEASGQEVKPGSGDHWAEKAGYADLARELGLDRLVDISDLNRAATREEAAIMVAELFDYETDEDWEDPFDDYKGKYQGHIQAVYDEGVFTGQGETGNFNGDDNLNRAEVAKVIRVAGEDRDFDGNMDDFLDKLNGLSE